MVDSKVDKCCNRGWQPFFLVVIQPAVEVRRKPAITRSPCFGVHLPPDSTGLLQTGRGYWAWRMDICSATSSDSGQSGMADGLFIKLLVDHQYLLILRFFNDNKSSMINNRGSFDITGHSLKMTTTAGFPSSPRPFFLGGCSSVCGVVFYQDCCG